MRNDKLKKRKRLQYFYMLQGALVMSVLILVSTKAHEAVNTAQAYTYEEAMSDQELAGNEMIYLNAENDIFKPAYMTVSMMESLGVHTNDIVDLPNVGKVVIKNIENMRSDVVVIYDDSTELDNSDLELYKYIKVSGGN